MADSSNARAYGLLTKTTRQVNLQLAEWRTAKSLTCCPVLVEPFATAADSGISLMAGGDDSRASEDADVRTASAEDRVQDALIWIDLEMTGAAGPVEAEFLPTNLPPSRALSDPCAEVVRGLAQLAADALH